MALPSIPCTVDERQTQTGMFPVRDRVNKVVGYFYDRDCAEAFVLWANRNLPDSPSAPRARANRLSPFV